MKKSENGLKCQVALLLLACDYGMLYTAAPRCHRVASDASWACHAITDTAVIRRAWLIDSSQPWILKHDKNSRRPVNDLLDFADD